MEGRSLSVKVAFACPTYTKPYDELLASVASSVPVLDAAGVEHNMVFEVGCPYISHARATMLRKALDWGADAVIFLDHDLSWDAGDLLKLVETQGDIVSGLYRYKKEEVEYMGAIRSDANGIPVTRSSDGAISGFRVPAGFLKVTRDAVRRFMASYPELLYGHPDCYSVDLFNHGAYKGVWYGEDMAFSRRWIDIGGEIWIVPDLNLNHHSADAVYPGNYHQFLLARPGGSNFKETD